jgi:hypothetical protein
MKHKNTILICQLEDDIFNLYVNGIHIGEITKDLYTEHALPNKIANNPLTYLEILDILNFVKTEINANKD